MQRGRAPRRWPRARPGFATSSSTTHNGDGGRPVPSRLADLARARGAARRRCATLGAGVAALLPGETIKHADVLRDPARDRPSAHVDRAAHDQGLPVARATSWRRTTRRAPRASRCGRRCRAARSSFQMNLREPFTFNMRADVRGADGPTRSRSGSRAYRDPAWRARRVGRAQRTRRCCRPNWDVARGRRERRRIPSSIDRTSPTSPTERGCTPLDVDARRLARRETSRPASRSVLANNDPEAIAWLLPQDDGAARAGRLRRARQPALRRVPRRPTCSATGCASARSCRSSAAIHKLTGEPAGVFGLADRGALAPGQGGRHHRVRPRHGRARPAAPRPRLPGRRRAARRRRARRA